MTKTYHFMGPGLSVWNFDALKHKLGTEGIVVPDLEGKEIAQLFGMKVISDPTLPEGRIEFRDPETGDVLLRFDVK